MNKCPKKKMKYLSPSPTPLPSREEDSNGKSILSPCGRGLG